MLTRLAVSRILQTLASSSLAAGARGSRIFVSSGASSVSFSSPAGTLRPPLASSHAALAEGKLQSPPYRFCECLSAGITTLWQISRQNASLKRVPTRSL